MRAVDYATAEGPTKQSGVLQAFDVALMELDGLRKTMYELKDRMEPFCLPETPVLAKNAGPVEPAGSHLKNRLRVLIDGIAEVRSEIADLRNRIDT